MASEKQVTANRANAQLGHGPTSVSGKATSSQNALKHGLDSKSEVMRCESRGEYETLIAEYYERFKPTVPEERCLIDMLIKSEWHSRRYMSVDAEVWENGFIATDSRDVGRVFQISQETFARVDRRLNSAQRNFQKALKQLTELRAKRANELPGLEIRPSEPTEPAETVIETALETEPLNSELGSFRQKAFTPLTPAVHPAENAPTPTENHHQKEDDPPIAA